MHHFKLFAAAGFALSTIFLNAPPTSAATPTTRPVSSPTVAVFHLNGELSETPADDLIFFGKKKTSLHDLVTHLKKAADDENVKGIVLLSEGGAMGMAQLEEIRQALDRCKKAGKPIYVHSDEMSMREFTLFACADHIGVVPTADVWVTGLYGESPYLRGLLDKLGVQPDFIHCGDYKSAVELYMRDGPSPEADAMQNWLMESIFTTAIDVIATGRHVDVAKAKQWIDDAPYTADKAKSAGLIDAVEQRQDFENTLKEKFGANVIFDRQYGEAKQPTLDLSSPFAFFKIWSDMINGAADKKNSNKPAIGIVYVDGEISLGGGEVSPFSTGGGAHSDDIRKALDEAAADDNIKAVVLRVDSPGGSAVASEIILNAAKRLHDKKPLVVSMGDVAGSGGYYVTCAADTIFADRSTITASIGVLGGKMVTTDMWKKVGITFKDYGRGKNAGIMSTSRTWNDDERQRISDWMNDVYGVFKDHVVAVRGSKLKKPISELAGGRVFTGEQALTLGLVDKIGTLDDATVFVANKARLGSDYEVRVVPEPKNMLEKLMEDSGGNEDPGHVMVRAAGALFAHASQGTSLVDLAMPYLQNLDPQRVAQIRAALRTLDMMQHEGVIMTTPELMMSK